VPKVPHHGSLTSSSPEFLQAIQPQIVVFSAGRANHFGHPALRPAKVSRHRCGDLPHRSDGAVTLDTDGHAIDVHSFTGRTLHVTEMQPRPFDAARSS
jgi:competence protein ComEC